MLLVGIAPTAWLGSSRACLADRWAAYQQAHPKNRIRDAARALGSPARHPHYWAALLARSGPGRQF
jgi:hypothetical protein